MHEHYWASQIYLFKCYKSKYNETQKKEETIQENKKWNREKEKNRNENEQNEVGTSKVMFKRSKQRKLNEKEMENKSKNKV